MAVLQIWKGISDAFAQEAFRKKYHYTSYQSSFNCVWGHLESRSGGSTPKNWQIFNNTTTEYGVLPHLIPRIPRVIVDPELPRLISHLTCTLVDSDTSKEISKPSFLQDPSQPAIKGFKCEFVYHMPYHGDNEKLENAPLRTIGQDHQGSTGPRLVSGRFD